MAQLNFTLNLEDIQAIIQKSGADDLSKQLYGLYQFLSYKFSGQPI